jgi:hypothetical protein
MSSIAKSKISISKKDLTKSRILPVASRNVVFYHKATMGDQTIDLLALNMPSEINLSQATLEEINDARLFNNKKNLALVSSSKGQLIQGLDYLVTSGYTINLIGPGFTSGAEADEIFIGTINAAPISDLAVASAKTVVKSYELAVGETTLNLGREYKLTEDGVLKVFVNGVLAQKDVDYEEVDAGNGYSSVIEFLAAPAINPYQVLVDFGVLAITDSNAIGDIESLAGSVKKLADDLAVVAGTDSLDYLNANPSEVERRWFGDTVLKLLDAEVPIVTFPQAYNPTVTNLPVASTAIAWSRQGAYMYIKGRITASGAATGTISFNLPSGYLIEVSTPVSMAAFTALGEVSAISSGGALHKGSVVRDASSTNSFRFADEDGSTVQYNATTPFTWASGFVLDIDMKVPIQGWSATQTLRQQLGL